MGPQRVAIPDVTKQSERAAEWNIQRRGLELASTAEMQLPGTPADQVLAQSPPANASQVAAPQTSLLVTVAADPPAYVMPSFVGQALGTCEPHAAGCGLQTRHREHGAAAGRQRSNTRPFLQSYLLPLQNPRLPASSSRRDRLRGRRFWRAR